MQIKPLNDKVAVKYVVEEKEEKTESGIVLPDTAKKEEKPQYGEVVAVGDKCCEDNEGLLSVGDKVVFDKYAGSKVELDEEEFVILSVDDVLAVIED